MNRVVDNALENSTAGFVRTYIGVSRGGGSEVEDSLRWVCATFEHLLDRSLKGREGWNGWIDGILPATDMIPDAVEIVSPVSLRVRGSAVWMKTGRGHGTWIEPFAGMVQIGETENRIIHYELNFGDAVRGLEKFPYGKHIRKSNWYFPEGWLFTFSASPGELVDGP